jgi:hypothetical protein
MAVAIDDHKAFPRFRYLVELLLDRSVECCPYNS